ncbi:V-type ATPase subunit [Streptomyces massasporeus]|uniref:V-type ATPase subunit n=1 Tax=Streptomyces massasporeus TaxID=67324 RepID=UPI00367C2520
MSAGWVAGVTRARALRTRCLGTEGIRDVAASPTLDDALRYLAATPYRRDVTPGATPAEAQRAVSATLLWHLRVLAGWQPATGADAIRALASGFEISNTERHLRAFTSGPPPPDAHLPHPLPPYRPGALAIAWTRLARSRTPSELRTVLAASAWGDPGDDSPAAVATGMRISAAVRLAAAVPDAARWAAARLALLFVREVFLVGRRLPDVSARRAARLLGPRAVSAGSYVDFRQALPATARWLLDDVDEASDLWRAEARWWEAVERDGHDLLHRSHFGPQPVVGAVALLSADAWRTRGALELAARGGGRRDRPVEVLDDPG